MRVRVTCTVVSLCACGCFILEMMEFWALILGFFPLDEWMGMH